jgi:hypothetical protein
MKEFRLSALRLSVSKIQPFITHFHRPETVGDHEHRDLSAEGGDGLHDAVLGLGIEGGGGLVEDEELRLVVEGAGEADALALAAGEADAAFADDCFKATGKTVLDESEDLGGGGGAFEGGGVDFLFGQAEGDVGGDRVIDEEDFLRHVTDAAAPCAALVGAERGVIDKDAAGAGDVEAEDEIDEGGLAAAGGADNAERGVFGDAERELVDHRFFRAGVVEAEVF